jgi:hypothetical protein
MGTLAKLQTNNAAANKQSSHVAVLSDKIKRTAEGSGHASTALNTTTPARTIVMAPSIKRDLPTKIALFRSNAPIDASRIYTTTS